MIDRREFFSPGVKGSLDHHKITDCAPTRTTDLRHHDRCPVPYGSDLHCHFLHRRISLPIAKHQLGIGRRLGNSPRNIFTTLLYN